MTLSERGLQQTIEQAGTRPCDDHTCEITLEMFTQEFLQHPRGDAERALPPAGH